MYFFISIYSSPTLMRLKLQLVKYKDYEKLINKLILKNVLKEQHIH